MIAQMKFAFSDIGEHLGRFFMNVLQITVSMLLIAFAIFKIRELNQIESNTSSLNNMDNIYIMNDITDSVDINHYYDIMENQDYLPKVQEFYRYLKQNDTFYSYTVYSYYLYNSVDGFEVLFADDGFVKRFDLKDEDDRSLIGVFSGDYDGCVPVLLGRSYHSQYKVGDKIEVQGATLQVAAFLAEKSFYFDLGSTPDPIYLDAEIICPPVAKDNDDIGDYVSAIHGTFIVTDKPEVLNAVTAKSREMGLFEFHFKSLSQQVDNIVRDQGRVIQQSIMVMVLILSLCVACMIASLLIFTEEHLREFAIHLLSGASLFVLFLRVLIQTGIPILIANAVALMIYGNLRISAFLLLFSVFLWAVIMVIPMIKLTQLGINGILMRGE